MYTSDAGSWNTQVRLGIRHCDVNQNKQFQNITDLDASYPTVTPTTQW